MKKYAVVVTVVAVAALAWIFLGPKDHEWRDRYFADIVPLQANEKILVDAIKRLEVERDSLYGQIDSANTIIASKTEEIDELKMEGSAIAAENKKLKIEIQPVLDANPKVAEFVAGLEAQIVNKDKIILAMELKYAEKEKAYDAKEKQFQIQLQITSSKDAIIENYKKREVLAQNTIIGLDKENSRLRKSGTVWKVVSIIEAGVIVILR